jgi:uncharacterized membrane protein YraQ (UPF0718 family)
MDIRIKEIINYFFKTLWKTLFLVGAGLLFAFALSAFVTPEIIDKLKYQINSPLLIIYAELIGFISPGPRYISYPILVKLKELGVSMGIIITLISAHVLIEPSTFAIEVGLFGYRFPVKRFFISFIITFCVGFLTTNLINFLR